MHYYRYVTISGLASFSVIAAKSLIQVLILHLALGLLQLMFLGNPRRHTALLRSCVSHHQCPGLDLNFHICYKLEIVSTIIQSEISCTCTALCNFHVIRFYGYFLSVSFKLFSIFIIVLHVFSLEDIF